MRETKFRAWDKDNLQMYYSNGPHDDGEWGRQWYLGDSEIWFEEMALRDSNPGNMGHVQETVWHKPNQILMQFTGLLDRQGKEIYEGDVIKKGNNKFIVEFRDGGFEMIGISIVSVTRLCSAYKDLEIIGNIYEHSFLLDNNSGKG